MSKFQTWGKNAIASAAGCGSQIEIELESSGKGFVLDINQSWLPVNMAKRLDGNHSQKFQPNA